MTGEDVRTISAAVAAATTLILFPFILIKTILEIINLGRKTARSRTWFVVVLILLVLLLVASLWLPSPWVWWWQRVNVGLIAALIVYVVAVRLYLRWREKRVIAAWKRALSHDN